MFLGLTRPKSAVNRTKPIPIITKGQGGSSASLAPRVGKPTSSPGKTNIFREMPFYDRGDLPLIVNFHGATRKLTWKVAIELLDFHHYLPIFFEGLRETEEPYKFMADKSIDDLLENCPQKVVPVLPQLIMPIKCTPYSDALSTKHPDIIVRTLKKLQKLVLCGNGIGEALVPYYRQILPVMNMFKNKRVNLGDKIEYGQYKQSNISDLIIETLELFEQHGGEDAFINIKYMVPTYESCMF